jgi:hypothetical protein
MLLGYGKGRGLKNNRIIASSGAIKVYANDFFVILGKD